MDLEARSLQPSVKAALLAKLREYKADLNRLKKEFKIQTLIRLLVMTCCLPEWPIHKIIDRSYRDVSMLTTLLHTALDKQSKNVSHHWKFARCAKFVCKNPAVKGTLNVLSSCAKTSSIKRVVLTSSMAAVAFSRKPLTPDVVVDETWFSDPSFCEETKKWYMVSKTLAEEAAWKFCKDNGIDLVTINPGYVIGPLLQPTLNLTVSTIFKLVTEEYKILMKENKSFSGGDYRFVDVRDVANAHIQAFEVPSASGRYCLVGITTYMSEAVKILRQLYPSLPLPETSEGAPPPPPYQVTKEKAKALGISFTPLEITLRDTIESFKEKGFLSI